MCCLPVYSAPLSLEAPFPTCTRFPTRPFPTCRPSAGDALEELLDIISDGAKFEHEPDLINAIKQEEEVGSA